MARWGRRGWRGLMRPRAMRVPFSMPAKRQARSTAWRTPRRSTFKLGGLYSGGSRRRASGSSGGRSGFRLGKRRMLLLICVLLMILTFQGFVFVERNLRPPLMNIATLRVKQIATEAINQSIAQQVAGRSDFEKLVDWRTDDSGKVSGFMLNYGEHMRITSETIRTVQNTLNEIKHIPEHIPIGQALGSAVIASFGPRVPVRFEPVGAAKVELNTRQSDAGINMILVEVYIRIVAEVAIIIPFDTKPEMVETEIPISYLLVVGDVPMYYYDNKGNPIGGDAKGAPNISLPMEPGKKREGVSTTLPQGEPTMKEGVSSQPTDHTPEEGSEGGQESPPEEAPASEPQSNAAANG
jgi:sporulation protein YunB